MSSVLYKGIDVSKWQGSINWTKVAASGVKFAIIRAGYGSSASQKDTKFEANYKGAKAAGLMVGAYWYSYATTKSGAKKEAAACLEVLDGKEFDLPVYFDQEYEKSILALSTSTRTTLCKTFAEAIKDAGYLPGIYASSSWFKSQLNASELTDYSIWTAQYASKCTCPVSYDIWQYSSSGSVSGISGKVDMNYMYTLPGSTDATSKTDTSTTTTTKGGFDVATLSTIKSGSSGAEVKSLQSLLNGKAGANLTVDGKFGSLTEDAVEAYQKAQGLTVDGICGQNTWNALLTT
ncbi:MAG: peptidoglycan-binding protein [Clostridiales bacterium]|nr:peptidoglycan-binding protein [Clostridiales bacterium]